MPLPLRPQPTAVLSLPGGDVTIRALSLVESRKVRAEVLENVADAKAIAWSTACTYDEAMDFVINAPGGDTLELVRAIFRISGLLEEARFPGTPGDDAGAARAPDADV